MIRAETFYQIITRDKKGDIYDWYRLVLILAGIVPLIMCGCAEQVARDDNPVIGNWFLKSPIYESGEDRTKDLWAVWDPFVYEFLPNGIVVVSGGAEPLPPTEFKYHLVGDSTLHIYSSWRGLTNERHYSITSVTSDTIWLRCNASYFVFPDSVGEISSGMVEFLERVKDD